MDKIRIDFASKKTEAGWQKVLDDFWYKITPKWFELLTWVLILEAFTYISENYNLLLPKIVTCFSYAALFFYLQSIFYSIEFEGLPKIKSPSKKRAVSLAISGLLSYVLWLVLRELAFELSGKI